MKDRNGATAKENQNESPGANRISYAGLAIEIIHVGLRVNWSEQSG